MLTATQHLFEKIYKIDTQIKISEFIFFSNLRKSEFIINEKEEEYQIGIYFDKKVQKTILNRLPLKKCISNYLSEYCVIIEEMSHLIYTIWNIQNDKKISLLELELQAEIDKFVVLLFIMFNQNQHQKLILLQRYLYDEFKLQPTLNEEDRQRYQFANKLAKQYTNHLIKFLLTKNKPLILPKLRKFYRSSFQDKLLIIAKAG